MLKSLGALFRGRVEPAAEAHARPRLNAAAWPAAVYAIGDVHGRFDLLIAMEKAIAADARSLTGEVWMVVLGDIIDRGPDSARVVAHLMAAPPHGFKRIVLAGNHEQMLLDFMAEPNANSSWLDFGGDATLQSYGVRMQRAMGQGYRVAQLAQDMQSLIPLEQLRWLAELPIALSLPGHLFVHAGVRPGVQWDDQSDYDLQWYRWDEGVDHVPVPGTIIVHGHTPAVAPILEQGRICVDTGAFATGVLSAVRLAPDEPPRIVEVRL